MPTIQVSNVLELKSIVYEKLCDIEKLEIGIFPMTEKVLTRKEKPCGIYFCLHGPRNVRFTAIWETLTNSVLFYGSDGERFMKAQLSPPLLFVDAD